MRWKYRKPAVIPSRTQDNSGLSCQCSATSWATTAGQPPAPTILHMYCKSGTQCLSCTLGSHSVGAVTTPLEIDRKILSGKHPGIQYRYLLCHWLFCHKVDMTMVSIMGISWKQTLPLWHPCSHLYYWPWRKLTMYSWTQTALWFMS